MELSPYLILDEEGVWRSAWRSVLASLAGTGHLAGAPSVSPRPLSEDKQMLMNIFLPEQSSKLLLQGGYVMVNLSALMEPMAVQPVTELAWIVQQLGPEWVGKNVRLQ